MTTAATTEPLSFRSGDSIAWTISDSDHQASAGWALSYTLISAAVKLTLTSAASGDAHAVSLTAVATAAYAAGDYQWVRTFTNAGTSARETTATGMLTVLPNLSALTTFDGRSHAVRMLAAIEAALESRATADMIDLMQASGLDRSIQRDTSKLIALRSQYAAEVSREQAAAGNRPGRGRIYMRF
ncbi:MAG: hypothetical protein M0Q15_15865 [Nevskia sp.]|jgi:hypothetical protein|nr:hypothetical protein [Nevskia sp.]